MKRTNFVKTTIFFFVLSFIQSYANEKIKTSNKTVTTTINDTLTSNKNTGRVSFATTPPVLKATGDQLYCPQNAIAIVTAFSITHDPLEPGTQAAYIQISSGYSNGFDKLALSNTASHPSIISSWDANSGKLTLSSPTGTDVLYSDLEAAIKDVVFTNSSATASGTKTFSITIGQANYLPSTQHYYLYVPSIGITWTDAKTAAEARTYYGLKGYLATISSTDEAKLVGEQASGTGWIGGSDAESEGIWKWVTGPEAGTIFWNGTANGSTPNFAFWNSGEPNNQGGNEKYAHITQPGTGTRGSWNDLSNTGDPSGSFQPKGYVVEYGGMPGELPLEIAASTKITIPVATPDINLNSVCDSGSFTLTATATAGATINWYDSAIGGTLLTTGNAYTTPILDATTTYYIDAGCESNRKPVIATVNATPNQPVANLSTVYNCGSGSVVVEANSNIGVINWFTTSTGGTSVYMGNSFTTPTISSNTTYYAEASNSICINSNRTPVNVVIYTPPIVTNETLALCQFQKITLDAGISGMTYLWNTGATSPTIDATNGGTYTVDITSPAPENCTSRKTIIVNEHQIPQIDRIDVNGTTAVIHLKKEMDYFEYSIDGLNFQDSNLFYNVPGGLQTAYAREKNGCGQTTINFVVLVFPSFFTPNNDSYNDLWEVTGMENYPQAEVTIFDRYGKLIAQLNSSKMSWDGTFDKTPLPASDYWYALKVDNTKPVLRGHFSLKR
ncbi:T9SS type B sorting domain-containing protein [Flavobacterium psychroterrae]|uniref:T9SS type B sorting domain-containing protein n=1 Tax=Flavobacterium psychroterrae TaxID=2133767 RepID=A0ABS5P763_9FLAO|nr:T9SS type B sorting domain-containing protein [Flavobacterium psychroterrae]MBS7230132.1 T9SS type B sorting domain-containing protein [Flavobacterium psychroterrae]